MFILLLIGGVACATYACEAVMKHRQTTAEEQLPRQVVRVMLRTDGEDRFIEAAMRKPDIEQLLSNEAAIAEGEAAFKAACAKAEEELAQEAHTGYRPQVCA